MAWRIIRIEMSLWGTNGHEGLLKWWQTKRQDIHSIPALRGGQQVLTGITDKLLDEQRALEAKLADEVGKLKVQIRAVAAGRPFVEPE